MPSTFVIPVINCMMLYFLLSATSCRKDDLIIMTVTGEIRASQMGITLSHEHILVDFVPIDSITPNRYNKDSVIARVLPYFEELRPYKVKTFVDCTPEFLGRDPQLLAELSHQSKINILTNVGWYAADKEKHLPKEIKNISPEKIAQMWIKEAKNGIGNTRIKPGFIKIGVNNVDLSENDQKLVSAACLTHLETGLTIMSHTGAGDAALAQLELLKKYGVDPSAFIWTHAMAETSLDKLRKIAQSGAWVAFDGIQNDEVSMSRIVKLLKYLKSIHLLNRVLLSHDAGWYQPGKPGGGTIRSYTDLFDSFIPLLLSEGFSREELDQMIVNNPGEAFGIRVKKAN